MSDRTIATDLGVKKLAYAQEGVPEYWVLDLKHQRLFVFREPKADAVDAVDAWADERVLKSPESISPKCMPDLELRVAEMFEGPGA